MYEQELKNYRMLNELAEPDGIVIFGGNADRELPLCELKQAFSIGKPALYAVKISPPETTSAPMPSSFTMR